MNLETFLMIIAVILLNITGFYLGYCYGREPVIEVNDDCVIYEEKIYCELENKLQINFGG